MIDIVYTLGDGSIWDDNELKHSLRSVEENLIDLRQVFIVGHCPDFIDKSKINYIPCEDPYDRNKDANIINKLLRACADKRISDRFIFNSDDQYFMRPIKSFEMKYYTDNDLFDLDPLAKLNVWEMRARRTINKLSEMGLKQDCFEAHIPYVIDKDEYFNTMLNTDYGKRFGYTVNSIYMNAMQVPREPITNTVRARIKEPIYSMKEVEEITKDVTYMNHNNPSIRNGVLKEFIENRFPKPSRYEKT